MATFFKCKYCGKENELSEALKQEVENQIRSSEKEKSAEEIKGLKDKLKQAEDAELRIRKEKVALEDEKRSWDLEKQRQLDREREQIRIKATEEQREIDKLSIRDKDQVIEKLKKSVDELQRKANSSGSQQLQGETQELDLEDTLRRLFPTDEIVEVKKGELGADTRQYVKTSRGTPCGMILWESKRTKSWDEKWIGKIKEDLRKDKGHIAAIVSEVVPSDIKKGIGFKEGVWVALIKFLEPLSLLLRKSLIDSARVKSIALNKQSKAEELYDLVTSHDFIQRMEGMIEIYLDMKTQIGKERVHSERVLKQREMQVDRLLSGVSGMYGSMQGIAGSALPQIKLLQEPEAEKE